MLRLGTQVVSLDANVSLSVALSIVSVRHLQIMASDSPEAPPDLFNIRFLL